MTNKQKIEALEKGIKSSVTPENLKEKMRTQLAQLKALEKESTSDKKPKFKVGDVVVFKGQTTLPKEITSYKQNSKGEFVYKVKYISKPEETAELNEKEIEIYVSEKKSKPKKIKPSNEDVLAILYNADSKGWNATKAESGGDIKDSDELTEKYANAVSKALKGIKKGSLSEEIFDELTNGNNHLLNEFLVWNGYYDAKTTATNKASYERIWAMGNRQVANPEVISLGAFKTSDELKVGQKYKNKKGDILTIKDFDVENHVTTNDGKGNLSSEAITRISTFKELIKDGELVLVSDKKIKPSSATPIKKASKNYYRNKEIKSVTVLENGKKVTYAGKDVLNGANFFKEGGALVSKAKYVPIRNIVEVTFEDGSKDKPRNGYHIKNGATPIMEHGGEITNNYEGKTAKEVWDNWSKKQREHFLADHYDVIEPSDLGAKDSEYKDLDFLTQSQIELHISQGQYEHGGQIELPEGSLQHFENYYLEKGGKVDKEYSLIGAKVTSDIRKQSGYVTGYNENYVDIYYPSLEFGESVLYKGKDQQNVMVVKDKPSLILNSVLKEDEFDNYFIEEIVEESTPIDYEGKDNSILIVLLRPIVSHRNDVYFSPIALILTEKGCVYKISDAKFSKWNEIVNDAEKDKLTYERYGYVKVGNFLKEEYKLGGALLSAWKRERKYVNKSEDYEVRYAKGKNRSGYKKYEDGGEVGDYAKVPVGYNMTHYGLIKKVITNDVLYPENGYVIAGIGDILHPEQFEVISSAEFNKLKKQGTEVKPNHFLIIEGKFEKGGSVDNKFNYMMLSRLQMDCDYYLGFGNRNEKVLWAGNVDDHIDEMKRIWNNLPKKEKPEWLSMEDILEYEKKMKSDKFEKGGVLSTGDEVYIFESRETAKVISIEELNDLEDEIVLEFNNGTTQRMRSSEVMKSEKPKVNPPYDPNSGLTLEEWKAKHNIQNYGKGGSTEKGKGKGAIFAIAKEIRKPGEKWQDAVARAGKLNK